MPIDSLSQLRQWQLPTHPYPIIEDGLLLPETALMLFGGAKSWKTMSAMHLAFCIAEGKDWYGYKTSPATILKIQVELPKFQDQLRTVKYCNSHSLYSKNVFFKTPEENYLLDTTYGKQLLMKDIEEVRRRAPNPDLPLVVFLDPTYLLMAGKVSDEEDVKRMLLNLNEVRRRLQVTYVIVHHSRLTKTDNAGAVVDMGAEDVMGSSYWNNWLDTMLRCQITNPFTGANTVKIQWLLTRNAQTFHPSFTVKWRRTDLTTELIHREIIEEEEPSVRDLI